MCKEYYFPFMEKDCHMFEKVFGIFEDDIVIEDIDHGKIYSEAMLLVNDEEKFKKAKEVYFMVVD